MARVTESHPSTSPATAPAKPAVRALAAPRPGDAARVGAPLHANDPARPRTRGGPPSSPEEGPLPLALWPLGQPWPATASRGIDGAPDPLWARVLESFSWPGELVLDPTCSSPDLVTEAARRRRLVVGLAADDTMAARLGDACGAALTASERRRARLLGPAGAGEALEAMAGKVDLVVAVLDQGRAPDSLSFAAWLRALRAGGVLVVASRGEVRRHALVDRAGEVVVAARAAGFTYLQHVVLLRAEIRDGDLACEPPPPELAARRRALARGEVRHLLVHENLSFFTKPAHEKEAPHGR